MLNTFANRERSLIYLFLISLFLLIFSNSVSADDVAIGTYKQRACVNLLQNCDNCTYVNVTSVSYPNSTFSLIGEYSMTKDGTVYSYSYCSTSVLGDYVYCTKGNPDGDIDSQCVGFSITTTGSSNISLIPLFLLIGGFVLLVLALFRREYIIGFASGTLLVISGVYILIYGLGIFNDLYTSSIAYVSLFLGLIVSFASIYEAMPEGGGGITDED